MRGQLQVSFAWIFGILAGVAVLSVILAFGGQSSQQVQRASTTMVFEYLDTAITASSTSKNTFNTISARGVDLVVHCDDPSMSSLHIEGAASTKPTRYQPIFSVKNLTGKEIHAWSQEWKMPETVSNFLYLSGPKARMVVVNDTEYAERFIEGLPNGFNFDVMQSNSYDGGGYDYYTFVKFQGSSTSVPTQVDGKKYTLNINPSSDDMREGKIKFIEDDFNMGEIDYEGKAMLYGAAFSGNIKHYSCNREKAKFRINQTSKVNRNRTLELMYEMSPQSQCKEGVDNVSQGIEANFDLQCNECVRTMEKLPELYTNLTKDLKMKYARNIRTIGQNLAKGRYCPTL